MRMYWAAAGLWLTVLLCNRREKLWSEPRIGKSVIISDNALVSTVGSGCCMAVLVGVEVFMEKPDQAGGMTVCCAGNWWSRKDVEETAVLKEQFRELTVSGTWEKEGKVESCERFGNVSSSRGSEDSGGLSLATRSDANVVCGDSDNWTVQTKLETVTGLKVEDKTNGFHRNKMGTLHWRGKYVRRSYEATRRRTAIFPSTVVNDQLFGEFNLTKIVSHFTGDLCDFVWTAPKKWSLGLSLWGVAGLWRKTIWPSLYLEPCTLALYWRFCWPCRYWRACS